MSDKKRCPGCGKDERPYTAKTGGDVHVYECGSTSSDNDGRYLQSRKCRIAQLERDLYDANTQIKNALHYLPGWREAVTELEDFCSEPVRLQNMMAAADQMDDWKAGAKEYLEKGTSDVK